MADKFEISSCLFISEGLVLKADAAQAVFDKLTTAGFKVDWDKTVEVNWDDQAVSFLLFEKVDREKIRKHLKSLNRPAKGQATAAKKATNKSAKKPTSGQPRKAKKKS